KDLSIRIEKSHLIVNRVQSNELPAPLKTEIEKINAPLLGVIPADTDLTTFEFSGKPLVDLGDDSPVYQAVEKMMGQILK
ncbi:MAG: hypothetical protein Q7J80_08115, partial [Anaerolineales bacterium]|nr:hypothetical protein [Anaerolineales bacterium]